MGGSEKANGAFVTTYEYAPELSQSSQTSLGDAQLRRQSFTPHPSNWRAWARQNYLSWRWYVLTYAVLCLLVTVILLIGLVSAVVSHGVDKQGRITLFTGDCQKSKLSSVFAHLFISGLGTYMLTASAYVMVRLRSTPCQANRSVLPQSAVQRGGRPGTREREVAGHWGHEQQKSLSDQQKESISFLLVGNQFSHSSILVCLRNYLFP